MKNSIPEVFSFFEKDSFSSDELDNLNQVIDVKYPAEKDNKFAKSLIKLEILKYQFADYIPEKKSAKKSKTAKTKSKRKKKSKYPIFTKEKANIKYIFIEDLTIENIANKIGINPDLILRYFRKKKLIYGRDDLIDEKTFSNNKDFFQSFYDALLRKSKPKRKKLKSKTYKDSKNTKISPGVYGKLLKSKRVGKLIYIRSK